MGSGRSSNEQLLDSVMSSSDARKALSDYRNLTAEAAKCAPNRRPLAFLPPPLQAKLIESLKKKLPSLAGRIESFQMSINGVLSEAEIGAGGISIVGVGGGFLGGLPKVGLGKVGEALNPETDYLEINGAFRLARAIKEQAEVRERATFEGRVGAQSLREVYGTTIPPHGRKEIPLDEIKDHVENYYRDATPGSVQIRWDYLRTAEGNFVATNEEGGVNIETLIDKAYRVHRDRATNSKNQESSDNDFRQNVDVSKENWATTMKHGEKDLTYRIRGSGTNGVDKAFSYNGKCSPLETFCKGSFALHNCPEGSSVCVDFSTGVKVSDSGVKADWRVQGHRQVNGDRNLVLGLSGNNRGGLVAFGKVDTANVAGGYSTSAGATLQKDRVGLKLGLKTEQSEAGFELEHRFKDSDTESVGTDFSAFYAKRQKVRGLRNGELATGVSLGRRTDIDDPEGRRVTQGGLNLTLVWD